MTLDLDALLAEVTPEAPCGEDLSYDGAMLELETEFAGKDAQQMGDEVVEGVEPNWEKVRDIATDLLGRTHNLRVIVNLAVAEVQLEGMHGLEQSLSLLHQMLSGHWETVHPQLDPEDDNDPLERMNILSGMTSAPGTLGDPIKFRDRVLSAKLTDSRGFGRIGYRDIQHSREPAPAEGEEVGGQHRYSSNEIDAAFQDTDQEWLLAAHESIKSSRDLVQAIDETILEKVDAGGAISFDGLLDDLKMIESEMAQQLNRLGHGVEAPDMSEGADAPQSGPAGAALSGDVNTARDAELALDKVIRYYEQHEPSSPVPVLVNVAKSMISKSFLEISSKLPPDTVELIVRICGEDGDASQQSQQW